MKSIGTTSRRSSVAAWLSLDHLDLFQMLLPWSDIEAVANQTGFRRGHSCVLCPPVVVWLMVVTALSNSSMTQGLICGWTMLNLHARRAKAVSEEAFCIARAHLPRRFWSRLQQHVVGCFERTHADLMRWKGRFRVLAADGTIIDVPDVPLLGRWFGRPRNQRGTARRVQARMISLCSVFTGFCVGFRLSPLRFAEQPLLLGLLRKVLRPDDLVVMDRGFNAYRLLALFLQRKAFFLVRLRNDVQKVAKRIRKIGENEWIVEIRPCLTGTRRKGLPEVFTLRMIRYQFPGFETSWLLTNVHARDVTRDELIELYHRRWQIETIFREWKHVLDVQNLRSKTPAGILKEIHAFVLLGNLVRWAMADAAKPRNLLPIDLSFTSAVTVVQTMMPVIASSPPQRRGELYDSMLEVIASHVIHKRPGRSFPRVTRKPEKHVRTHTTAHASRRKLV